MLPAVILLTVGCGGGAQSILDPDAISRDADAFEAGLMDVGDDGVAVTDDAELSDIVGEYVDTQADLETVADFAGDDATIPEDVSMADNDLASDLPTLADLAPVAVLPPGDFLYVDSDHFVLRAQHVRYKVDNGLFNDEWFEHDGWSFWADRDVNEDSREAMFLSEVWRPASESIRQIVLLAAGQQGTRIFPSAYPSIVTGQDADWRPDDDSTTKDFDIAIRRLSLAGMIIEDGMWGAGGRFGFKPDDTLLLVMYDAGFNYMLSAETKQAVVNAYIDWMVDRLQGATAQVNRVFFSGASRGGCLSLRLGHDIALNSAFSDFPILIGTFDGVCRASQNEGGTTEEEPFVNPLNSDYMAYRTNLAEYFTLLPLPRVSMWQVVGGAPVIDFGPVEVAHAFIDSHVMDASPDYGFDYEAGWVNLEHQEIGRPWREETVGALLGWLEDRSSNLNPAR